MLITSPASYSSLPVPLTTSRLYPSMGFSLYKAVTETFSAGMHIEFKNLVGLGRCWVSPVQRSKIMPLSGRSPMIIAISPGVYSPSSCPDPMLRVYSLADLSVYSAVMARLALGIIKVVLGWLILSIFAVLPVHLSNISDDGARFAAISITE